MFFVLPTSYFPDIISIIAVQELNFSVRNGKRCDPLTESGEQKTQNKYLEMIFGGGKRTRTSDLRIIYAILFLLSYDPTKSF